MVPGKKDYESYYKKFSIYVKQDPVLAIIKASDEMSRPTPKRSRKVIESLKKEWYLGRLSEDDKRENEGILDSIL